VGLQRFDLHGKCGLNNVQSGGCAPEMQLIGDGNEISKLPQFHRHQKI
jgi:hypothetical protein